MRILDALTAAPIRQWEDRSPPSAGRLRPRVRRSGSALDEQGNAGGVIPTSTEAVSRTAQAIGEMTLAAGEVISGDASCPDESMDQDLRTPPRMLAGA